MSFSISITGASDKEDAVAKVAEALESQPNGQPLQSIIESAINALPDQEGRQEILVISHGHFHQGEGTGQSYFEIKATVNPLAGDPSNEIRDTVG